MHTRRVAALLIGAWLAGGIFMASLAIGGFHSVDRLLEAPSPDAMQYLKVLGGASARTMLRYLVSEQNRHYFYVWELVQLGMAVGLFATIFTMTEGKKVLLAGVFLMTLLVLVEHFLLTPYLSVWGRAIDFVPPEAPSPERFRFWQFHTAYSWLEVVKGLIAVGLCLRLTIHRSRRQLRSRQKVESIDDADNG
jgi:hypothetical protein